MSLNAVHLTTTLHAFLYTWYPPCSSDVRKALLTMNPFKQPQRPPRTLRVYGDENAMPAIATQKTIHHRNKSSPALSTMIQKGSKRTAFGDVSNVANVARPSKDDLMLNGKIKIKPLEKPLLQRNEKLAAPPQRPAQRPLSISGLKSLLGGINSQKEPIFKQPLAEIQQNMQLLPQPANPRNIPIKKSIAVLRDEVPIQPEQPKPDLSKLPLSNVSIAPVHRELPAPPTSNGLQGVIEDRFHWLPNKQVDVVQETIAPPAPTEDIVEQLTPEDPPATRSDGVFIDGNGAIQVYDLDDLAEYPEETVELAGMEVPVERNGVESTGLAALDQLLTIQPEQPKSEVAKRNTLPPVSEPEEYWEEDAVENYDEEGYVTARSFKSRTDSTTGNATTVLFPKVTQKTKKEISAAKDLIEGSKTLEELEDEAWDTTMVAEYGDEIFGYMKDLEVNLTYDLHIRPC